VVCHYGDAGLTARCLDAIDVTAPQARVIVVDNACAPVRFSASKRTTVLHPGGNLGFAAGCNLGAERAVECGARTIVFLNNDTVPQSAWLWNLLAPLCDPGVGIVGARLVHPDGTLQHSGVKVYDHPARAENMLDDGAAGLRDAVTGACMAIRAHVFAAVAGFDAGYWNGYEDVDLCLKARAARWRVWYEAGASVVHLESASGSERWAKVRENCERLHEKWSGRLPV
jgi:GT2 family glycosyltransferase